MMQSAPISEELYDSLNSNQKPTQPKTKVAIEDTTISPFEDGGGDDEDDDDDDSIRNLSNMTPCTPSVGSFDSSYATDDSPSNISPPYHHHHHQQQQQQKGDEEHHHLQQQEQQYNLFQYSQQQQQQQQFCRSLCRRQRFEGPQNYPHRYHNQQQHQHSHPPYFPQQQEQHNHHLQQQFQALTIGNTTAAIGAVGGGGDGGGGGRRRGPAVISTSLCSVESMSDYYSMRERSSNDFDENDGDDDDDDDDVVVGDDDDEDKDDDDDNNDDVDDVDEVVGAADDDDEDDDDVFSKDGVSGNSAFPSTQRHGVSHSRPIPIRSVARRNRTNDLNTMNHHHHHNNNNHNNNNNGSTSSYGSPSSFPMSMDHHFMANFRNNFPQHFQGPHGMSPDCCQAGNILVSCSWGSELRRTIGTQTYPMFRRTSTLFGIQTPCHLHNQSSIRAIISSTGSVSRRLYSEGEDSSVSPRQDPLPDLVPVPRDRAHSLPEVPLRRHEHIRAIGQELRRISDEYYQNRHHSHHQEKHGINWKMLLFMIR
ncbi:transcription factor mef2A-like isoform X2 [Octopus bimaculoides]|uniref:transcription factor mef2A-like isoform X2 n=1 Tax=Octopus bimaculoides TaxID=37653 RepID=UPI0022E98A66|nr:transcription factor mef2A-like isoform X2 [Octopus bimaculoides]